MRVLKVFMVDLLAILLYTMRILFAGRTTACKMDVFKVFIVDLLAILLHRMIILFAGRPIACEMGVLEDKTQMIVNIYIYINKSDVQ